MTNTDLPEPVHDRCVQKQTALGKESTESGDDALKETAAVLENGT